MPQEEPFVGSFFPLSFEQGLMVIQPDQMQVRLLS